MHQLIRLTIIVSHPTQYYSPWFRFLASRPDLNVTVLYLWDFGATRKFDASFGCDVRWDVPLLDGYEHVFVPNRSKKPGTKHFNGLDNATLNNYVSESNPDAVLLFGYGWRSNVEYLLRYADRYPVIMRGDSHSLIDSKLSFKAKLRRYATRFLLHRCGAFAAVGKANAEFYRGHGIADDCIFHVPHCVDNERFSHASVSSNASSTPGEILPNLDDSTGTVKFLFVGKFERKKRPDLLIQSFLRIENKDAALWMVGAGELEPKLRQLAENDARIRFLGFKNQTELPSIYQSADVIVLPSEGHGETWGLVINEAMNCGCVPVVSDHVGCYPDLVKPDKNGWVFQAGCVEDLTRCLNECVSNSKRLRTYANESYDIIQNYDYAHATNGLMDAIRFAMK